MESKHFDFNVTSNYYYLLVLTSSLPYPPLLQNIIISSFSKPRAYIYMHILHTNYAIGKKWLKVNQKTIDNVNIYFYTNLICYFNSWWDIKTLIKSHQFEKYTTNNPMLIAGSFKEIFYYTSPLPCFYSYQWKKKFIVLESNFRNRIYAISTHLKFFFFEEYMCVCVCPLPK